MKPGPIKEHFQCLLNHKNVKTWNARDWQNFCKAIVATLTVVPGINKDYVDEFYDVFAAHEALESIPTQNKSDSDEKDNGDTASENAAPTSLNKKPDPSQASETSRNSSNASDTKKHVKRPEPRSSILPEVPTAPDTTNNHLPTTSDPYAQQSSQCSDVKILDLDAFSETEIRAISLDEGRSYLVLVTLEGGAQGWCDLQSLRTKKRAVGEEIHEVLDGEAENMQNNGVGK